MIHHASIHAMSIPQMHSPDYYFRVPGRKLGIVQLQHSFTEPDPGVLKDARQLGIPARGAGMTEWAGTHERYPLSLGWDWVELADGDIRPVMVIAPRTNLRLVDAKGYDVPDAAAVPFLWEFIGSLDWRPAVAAALAAAPLLPRAAA